MTILIRWLLRLLFRYRPYNDAVLTTPGPVLLVPNHVSWLDWLFLGAVLDSDWKFVVSSTVAGRSWVHRRIMINHRSFPIDPDSPYAVKRMAEHLKAGGRLVLFAEGRISATGSLMKLFDGTGFLLFKTHAKVITCYLRGANRLRWVEHAGWRRWLPEVTAHFSGVLDPPRLEHISTTQARGKLTNWLREQLVEQQFQVEMEMGPASLLKAVLQTARQQPKHIILEDATLQALNYRRLLMGADLLARKLRPALAAGPERVGLLLPNVNALPVVMLSLWSLDRVPAVLNFSTGMATMLSCAQLAGLKQIITSRAFLERAKLNVAPLIEAGLDVIYLEDLRASISTGEKLAAALRHRMRPGLGLSLPGVAGDRPAVVLFTSGSEGVPKGVELSHLNILANIRQMLAITDLEDHDRIFNALPLFHSFGLTVGTLLPLVRGMYAFLYPSPLHYRIVPAAIYDRNCTVFLSTNTFLNGYARKAHSYDFRSLRYLFAAAEKLQEATATTWSQRFGVRILEGYGATECSPCVSVNTPLLPKYGSVGRLLPGMEYKLEPVEGVSDESEQAGKWESTTIPHSVSPPRPPHTGRLFVRGPNVMRGYLNPDANAAFKALGGWYDTGDIVQVDDEGFLHIRGRLKRFAKVSGEMVSLTAVEDALAGAFPQYGLRCQVAVISRPDEDKGEVLIAITNEPKLQLDEIRAAIKAKSHSNLCVPREIKYVREIPKLGTGKVDHRELVKQLGS